MDRGRGDGRKFNSSIRVESGVGFNDEIPSRIENHCKLDQEDVRVNVSWRRS